MTLANFLKVQVGYINAMSNAQQLQIKVSENIKNKKCEKKTSTWFD
jgi:hypothetical protein